VFMKAEIYQSLRVAQAEDWVVRLELGSG
jgi:hypothetical protein